ncbi:MAG TPA: SDR family oxidoreductase [Noviherbaspirillum sp.]|nr:SDR family oxidoreductase [Noviherbaspirillum sp.]
MNVSRTKTALVTGASGGIGKSIAEQFASHGHNVVIVARNLRQLQFLAQEWSVKYKVTVTPVTADLAIAGAAHLLADDIRKRKIRIDYLVNNAGYGLYGLSAETRLDDELAMMNINMVTLTALTKLFLPDVLSSNGRIMNVASTAAFQPGPYMAVYYATKSYVLSYSEALASELAGTGVTVTAFCPGPTRSGFQDKAEMNDSALVKGKRLPSAETIGIAGYRAMMAGKTVYIPGLMNRLMAFSVRFTPRCMTTTLVKKMSAPA